MQVGVVGINHKQAGLKLRELLAKACGKHFGSGKGTHQGGSFLLLSTCNRTEIYFSDASLSEAQTYILNTLRKEVGEEFDQKLYSFFGLDCFTHLCRVTAGLDSAIVAETEIQGQVKQAYEHNKSCASLPNVLHFLFQKSLRVGKKIRSEMDLQRGMPDLEHTVLNVSKYFFDHPEQAKFLFIGASNTNQKILRLLFQRGLQKLTLCNRTDAKAEWIAGEEGISNLPWGRVGQWTEFDAIILGTKSPDILIDSTHLPKDKGCKLIIDLSVPRNADPDLGKCPGVTLLNIDHLNRSLSVRRKRLARLLEQAERTVAHGVVKYGNIFREKEMRRNTVAAS